MKFVALVLALFWFAPAHAALNCGASQADSLTYHWCIEQDAASTNPDIVYYFHGGGGNEKDFFTSERWQFFRDIWTQSKGQPTVIAFSFHEQWLLGDVATDEHPALLPIVLDKIIPALEAKAGNPKGKRVTIGHSLGGYNGTELALRAPDLFYRGVSQCPGMASLDPWSTEAEVDAFLKTQSPKVKRDWFINVMQWVQHDFGTKEIWARHDPVQVARALGPKVPAFFVTVTRDDEYGFFAGAELFAKTVMQNSPASRWVPAESGGHCFETEETTHAIAEFLIGN